jgi:hypothetical protein
MKREQLLQTVSGFGLVILLWLTYAWPALAIGPGTGGSRIRVDNKQVGPFVLLVATSPLPVTVGQMSIWVRVTGSQNDDLRRDALVVATATLRDGGATVSGQGTHQNAGNNFDYVAHLEVQQPGQWDITISVEDELGEAEIAFTETVAGGLSIGLIIGIAVPFVALAVVVGIYLWRRSG